MYYRRYNKEVNVLGKRWWDKSVIYQVYPKSFYDSNNDGIGDIRGIIEKLDYLKDLGIDIIWLSPVYKSPMDDNGYDISDYYDIDKQFGSMEDMDSLIEEGNKRGIKIMMDLVINHTSDENAWFIESKSSIDNPKRNFYIWKDPKPDGSAPNNWRSIFGGSAWEYDENTKQYYLHVFSKKQPDLNWENEQVRKELYKMVNYWLDKGLGGFRVDAITYIKKDNTFKSLEADDNEGLAHINAGSLNQEGIENFLAELKENTFSKYDIVTVAEAPGIPREQLKKYSGPEGFFDLLFEFGHSDLDVAEDGKWYTPKEWTLQEFKDALFKSQEVYNDLGFGALFLENHDQPRSLNKLIKEEDIGLSSAKMLATIYFLLKGIPFVYQGEEIGMTNVKYDSIEEYNDISSIDQYNSAIRDGLSKEEALTSVHNRSRDNARIPMQWDDSKNAGFTKGKPWLKANNNYKEVNVKNNLEAEDSILNYYKKLIDLRKNSEYSDVIVYGKYKGFMENDKNIFAYIREYEDKKLLILANFYSQNIKLKLNYTVEKVLLSNYGSFDISNGEIFLKPYEALVLAVL
ncbi:oligo-1,6-glucosidase [Clostridium pasteurianum DSM 525 = ATCC 6013]|uniref:Oligo-1,6-glucosidase n=1 Tax=Clostridium pasteurianum DSM 525 = ATCC 6013 TaxID=1262449 RepID=A0A0H3JB73_CLOPA|nr:oligo-1,6-glucosidase [Clostridium pasteurianum DSM 525 = ATCC 6013]AJA53218.1 oligo-1,6-glucosidase [Clostridium pasteurianum DSM 525 = ATCC 6013]KRU10774.1 Oligo-1,6-glucosidase [Clostridium pasteurianum DSM 525 = ATCC 6013]